MDANDLPDVPPIPGIKQEIVDKSGDPKTPAEGMSEWLDSMSDSFVATTKDSTDSEDEDISLEKYEEGGWPAVESHLPPWVATTDTVSIDSVAVEVGHGEEILSAGGAIKKASDKILSGEKPPFADGGLIGHKSDGSPVFAASGGFTAGPGGGGGGGGRSFPSSMHVGVGPAVGGGGGADGSGKPVGAYTGKLKAKRWLPGEVGEKNEVRPWYAPPTQAEFDMVHNNGYLNRIGGDFESGTAAHEAQSLIKERRSNKEIKAKAFSTGMPRRIQTSVEPNVSSSYEYLVVNDRLGSASVVGRLRDANQKDFDYFYADAARNNAMLERRGVDAAHKPMFGVHPDAIIAPIRHKNQPSTIRTLDMIRFMWDQYSGNAFRSISESSLAWCDEIDDVLKSTSTANVPLYNHKDKTVALPVGVIQKIHYEDAPVYSNVEISASDTTKKKESKKSLTIGSAGEYKRPNGEKYLARKVSVGGGSLIYDVQMIQTAREKAINVLLSGRPGTGKTALCEAALENLQTIECDASTEAADFIGSYVPTGHDTFEWKFGPLAVAAMNGWPLLVDEIAMCDPRELPVVYSAMDGRKKIHITSNPEIGSIDIKDGFYVIGACNPDVPGAIMSDALLSRFPLQLEVTTDYSLLRKLGVDDEIIVVASNLAKQVKEGTLLKAPQTRELLAYQKLKETFGIDAALANFVGTADPSDMEIYISVVSASFGAKVEPIKI